MINWVETLKNVQKDISGIGEISHRSEEVKEFTAAVESYIGQDELQAIFRKAESLITFRIKGHIQKMISDPETVIKKSILKGLEKDPALTAAVSRAVTLKLLEDRWTDNPPSKEALHATLAPLCIMIMKEIGANLSGADAVEEMNSVDKTILAAMTKPESGQTTVDEIIETAASGQNDVQESTESQQEERKDTHASELPHTDTAAQTEGQPVKKRTRKRVQDVPLSDSGNEPVKQEQVTEAETHHIEEQPASEMHVEHGKVQQEVHEESGDMVDEDPFLGVSAPKITPRNKILYVISSEYAGGDIFIRDAIKEAYGDNVGAVDFYTYNIDKNNMHSEDIKRSIAAGRPVAVWNYPWEHKDKLEAATGATMKLFVVTGMDKPADYSDERKSAVKNKILGSHNLQKPEYTMVTLIHGNDSESYRENVQSAAEILN